jgi:predicted phosphodiesterase
MKIGFLTDVHFREVVPGTSRIMKRECRRMGEVLDRCLESLVKERVDVLVCAGDCVDEPDEPGVLEDLTTMQARFAATGIPAIVIPGNHDPAPEVFYQVVARPPRVLRAGGGEVVTFFDDVWQPEIQRARRDEHRLSTMRDLLASQAPEMVTFVLQHYVVYPEHIGPGYNHTLSNDAEIRTLLEASPRRPVVLSGHYHAGHSLTEHNGVTYFTGRALCERPFPYYVLETSGQQRVHVREMNVDG